MKLYRVTCKGMTYSIAGAPIHGIAYVVAENPDQAYKMLRKELDRADLGFTRERALDKIELIADSYEYSDCGYRLLI